LGEKYNLELPGPYFDASHLLRGDPTSKVMFYKVDFGAPFFDLNDEIRSKLLNDVDCVIHNAWKVNFNHTLQSFEEIHIRGVRNFVNWSIESPKHPAIFFVSSISSVGNTPSSLSPVSEDPQKDFRVASQLGYGESKHVSERILSIASERSGVPINNFRVGQIAGPLKKNGGQWNKTEWLPCLIKSSLELGVIPASLPPIDWIPVDVLAEIMVEIVHSRIEATSEENFNLVNPKVVDWFTLLGSIQDRCGGRLKVAPFHEWVEELKKVDANDVVKAKNIPAVKIIDFFEGLASAKMMESLRFRTENGRRESKTMRKLTAVQKEWMEVWLDQWDFQTGNA